nr:hypothetical protein [Curtobacterium sp. PhB172]
MSRIRPGDDGGLEARTPPPGTDAVRTFAARPDLIVPAGHQDELLDLLNRDASCFDPCW